ncbi:MAG: alpha/beta fold hydrolase [Nitrosomonas sp.]|nr:alpha/beta fold hydrolase [Nitrosomonas sp.]
MSETEHLSAYCAPKWLPGGNAQTIYPYLLNKKLPVHYRRERWELKDGDFIDVDWLDGKPDKPLVVLLHGLEGGSNSHYALSIMRLLQAMHWCGAVIHFRGCSGHFNRLPRAYHAGDSTEIDWMLRKVVAARRSAHDARCYVVGVSLGGNALLKWLGEQGERAMELAAGAVAVSTPVDLAAAGNALDSGFNRIYTQHFLASLKRKVMDKNRRFPGLFNIKAVMACKSLYEFDNLVTAPLHGFRDTGDYWQQSSCKQWLKHIQVPTLLINARNDPFFPERALPVSSDISASVSLEFPEQGGHVGFIHGTFPGKLEWLPGKIVRFFLRDFAYGNDLSVSENLR